MTAVEPHEYYDKIVKPAMVAARRCGWCGAGLSAYTRADALYCSPSCRADAANWRKRWEAFCAAMGAIRPSGHLRSPRRPEAYRLPLGSTQTNNQ